MAMRGGPGAFRLDDYNVKLSEVDPRVYRLLRDLIRPYLGRLGLGVAMMVVTAVTGLVGPYLTQVAIDRFIAGGDPAGLDLVALAFLATALLNWWSSYGQTYIVSFVGQSIIYDLRDRMFRHLQRLSFRFFDSMATGRIMSRLISDVDAVNQLVSSGLVTLFADSLVLITIMGTMLWMNWRLALVSFITIPTLLLVLRGFRGWMRDAFMTMRRRAADLNAHLAEAIAGIRVTQAYSREARNQAEFDGINERFRQANMRAVQVWATLMPAIEVVSAFGVTLVLWYGGVLLRGGTADVTVGQVAAFILYLNRFFMPIRDLSQVFNVFQAAVVSAERVAELLNQQPEIADRPDARPLPRVRGAVEFRDVVFGYEPGQAVLHGVNLRAEPGETVALVGPTGAGKSSIINLLARFYEPWEGQVLVDGVDLSAVTQRSWRSQLGIVLQDTFLFSGTIRENIRYGRPDATDAEVEAAARAVGAHDFIVRLEQGYETEVQERGAKLSVGQRQLIAFARALCADPAVLILDEATSNIDTYTESVLQEALRTLLHGRTAFVIAHRLSTIRQADRIYYIEDGQVVEEGRHEELLALGGRYAQLYRGQWAGEE
ncbi:ABC-type multidrug transport system fused ATPase/permease subunit [Symbiobacterium terraclitae]|uniref:ABC-type multidrug transport system fused ATPase/permease subunit n=2 Tax=Symbiobacterium terraclitae TaxID=557451 RepID=A0ABS4JSB7_9FIRM|nr:ABC-type multidrug transport system fused ATPase/permease subunit [Symbiobacterium terraclitae]